TGGLPPVQGLVTLWVVAHQYFTEGWVEGFDMLAEVLAILEIKLVLPALFGWTRGRVAVRRCIAKNGCTELFVYQDAGFLLGHAGGDGSLESVIDHLFRSSNLRCLLLSQLPFPAEQLRLERATMIEWLDVQRFIITDIHNVFSLSWRQ